VIQQVQRASHRRVPAPALMLNDRLGDLLADRIDGIERRRRLLEDHGDRAAAQFRQLGRRQIQQVLAFQPDAACGFGIAGQQSHQRLQADALAGAGLTQDGQRLTTRQREEHAIHGGHVDVTVTEPHRQVVDAQHWRLGWHDVRHGG
jgi:hypothetical protein